MWPKLLICGRYGGECGRNCQYVVDVEENVAETANTVCGRCGGECGARLPEQDDEDEDELDPQLERQTAEHPGGQFCKHNFIVKVTVSVTPFYLALNLLEQQKNVNV